MNRHTQAKCVGLVTGAASGLGKAIADAYAHRGLRVVYADIDEEKVIAAAREAGPICEGVKLDVSDSVACKKLIDSICEKWGRIDLLVTCAGFATAGEVQYLKDDDWKAIVDVNLMGTIYCATSAYKQMHRQGGGQIAIMSSLAGLVPLPIGTPYATTKGALVSFAHSLRGEGIGLGVKVSLICPGFVETNIFENTRYHQIDKEEFRKLLPFPVIKLDVAVAKCLSGIDANRSTIVFPAYAILLWWAQRLFPLIPHPLTNWLIKRLRSEK